MKFDNAKRLQEKAMFLRLLLEHESKQDADVRNLLGRVTPLLEKIEQGKITPPSNGVFNRCDFSDEYYPFISKYPAIFSASADFSSVLEDWNNPFPESDRDEYQWLRERALPFRQLLDRYALVDAAAKQLQTEMQPLLDSIDKLKIAPPMPNEFRWWFTNRDSPLFNKYPDLTEAASNFDGDLEDGWFITGKGKLFGRD